MSSGEKEQKRISRREFVKGAAVGAAGVAAAGALASCTPEVVKETVEVPVEVIKEVVVTKEVPVEVIKEVEAKSWLPDKWDMETDVLVVGSGHCGGLPAAIEAKKAGADVIIIEKEDHAGGLSLIGGDTFTMGGNNWLQQQEGVVDDDEVWFQDEMFSTGYRAVPEIIRTLIKRGPDTCLWLKSLGLEWRLTAGVLRSPIKRGFDLLPSPNYPGKETMADGRLKDGGMGFYTVMRREVDRLGIPVLLKHRMRSIYREPNGPVLGVKVDTPQGTINIKARKAVHLATGTWSDNYRMVQAWDPRAVGPDCYGDGGTPCDGTLFVDSAGDGHLAAAEIGAGFSDMSYVAYYYISYGSRSYFGWDPVEWTANNVWKYPAGKSLFNSAARAEHAILVKNDGMRWINEAEVGRQGEPGCGGPGENPEWPFNATYLSLPQPRNIWVVTDADGVAAMEWPEDEMRNPNPKRGAMFDPACLAIADTLAELASKMNIPVAAFEATVSRYNGFVDAGEDADFGKPMPLNKIQTPPFYAAKASLIRHTQRNGLRVNTKSQVIEQSDQRDGYSGIAEGGSISIDAEKVIPHLYAAGELGNCLGWRREHNSVGHYITASPIAGENAAKETPWS